MEISEEQEDKIYQLLDNLASDLVSDRKYNHVLKELFSKTSGEWFTVSELNLVNESFEKLISLFDRYEIPKNDIVFTWLKRPNVDEIDPYALILFYCDEMQWNTVAIFNRSTL